MIKSSFVSERWRVSWRRMKTDLNARSGEGCWSGFTEILRSSPQMSLTNTPTCHFHFLESSPPSHLLMMTATHVHSPSVCSRGLQPAAWELPVALCSSSKVFLRPKHSNYAFTFTVTPLLVLQIICVKAHLCILSGPYWAQPGNI